MGRFHFAHDAAGFKAERGVGFPRELLHAPVFGEAKHVQPLDLSVSGESWANLTRTDRDGLHPASGDYWPHVLLQADRSVFTSMGLPLRKPL